MTDNNNLFDLGEFRRKKERKKGDKRGEHALSETPRGTWLVFVVLLIIGTMLFRQCH